MRQGLSSGTLRKPVAKHRRTYTVWMRMLIWALLEYPWCVLGRDVSSTEDIDAGMFPFAARMASIRPILFSGLFCLVLLSRINRERLIHFSRKTGYSKIRQVTMNETGALTHNNIYKGTKQHARQTPPWCAGLLPPQACRVHGQLASFFGSQFPQMVSQAIIQWSRHTVNSYGHSVIGHSSKAWLSLCWLQKSWLTYRHIKNFARRTEVSLHVPLKQLCSFILVP